MDGGAFLINVTSIINNTEGFDLFCVSLFVDPLVWVVFSVPCACVGIPASVSVLWVLIQRQHNGFSNNIYMLNLKLTIMDLITNISKLPILLNFFVWQDRLTSSLLFVLECLSMQGRPLLMACICVDCYMAVVFPIAYMKMKQSRMVVCVLVWVFTLMFNLFCVFWTSSVPFSIWGVPCFLSVSTIIFCDLSILCALRKPDPSGRSTVHPQKQRALQTITNSFTMTIVSYVPIVVVNTFKDIIPLVRQEWLCSVFIPAMIFSMLGGTILPLLYLENLGILKNLMRCVCVRNV